MDYGQALLTAGIGVVPVLLYMAKNRKQAKTDVEARHEQNLKAQTEFQNKIKTMLEYHPPHTHTEEEGPLQAEGIWPRPKGGHQ